MAKATAIKLGELNICLPRSVYVQKKFFHRGRVVPDFPVDGHIYIYIFFIFFYIHALYIYIYSTLDIFTMISVGT